MPLRYLEPVELGAAQSNRSTVRSRVRQEQDHAVEPAVAQLQLRSAHDRLRVAQPGLRPDADRPAVLRNHGVPCADVARNGQGHLGPPSDGRGEATPEPAEERDVAGVPDRVPARVVADREVQADDHPHPCQLPDGCAAHATTLQAGDGRVGDAAARGHLFLTEARRQPRQTQLAGRFTGRTVGKPVGPVKASFGGWHGRQDADRSLPVAYLPVVHAATNPAHEPGEVGPFVHRAHTRDTERALVRRAVHVEHNFGRCDGLVRPFVHPAHRSHAFGSHGEAARP